MSEPTDDVAPMYRELAAHGVTPEDAARGVARARREIGNSLNDPRCTSLAPSGYLVQAGTRCQGKVGHRGSHSVSYGRRLVRGNLEPGEWTRTLSWKDPYE